LGECIFNLREIHSFDDEIVTSYEINVYGERYSIKDTLPKLSSANNSSLMYINGNLELENHSSSGDGSIENPFHILNKVYDVFGSVNITYGIYIKNTNKHLVISNCSAYGADYGLVLNNVTHVLIDKNRIIGNERGIVVYSSRNITFTYNIVNNNDYAINIQDSINIILENNSITANSIHGLFLNNSDYSEIIRNLFYSNQNGIKVIDSNYNRIIENNLEDHMGAISLIRSNFSIIMNNYGTYNLREITENNCQNNYFFDNFLELGGITDTTALDLTVIVFSCISFFSVVYVVKSIYNFKKLSRSSL